MYMLLAVQAKVEGTPCYSYGKDKADVPVVGCSISVSIFLVSGGPGRLVQFLSLSYT